MDAQRLRELQAPLKARYREAPESAMVHSRASGRVNVEPICCEVDTDAAPVIAGLHSAAGGTGHHACSSDMLLQALVACSGVTLAAVASAMSVPIHDATVHAEADMDFRGTLAVDKSAPVGITHIRLRFEIDSPEDDAVLQKLTELTERYCVVLQTLVTPAHRTCQWARSSP